MYIEDQLRAGIDIISDGSQLRSDMVRIFTSKIAGIRDRGKPVAERKLVRRGPIMVEDVKYARKLIPPYASLKAIITGPYTLAMNCEFVHTAYSDYRELAFDFARILNEELREVILAVPDIVYVQVDEPVFSVDFPDFARSSSMWWRIRGSAVR